MEVTDDLIEKISEEVHNAWMLRELKNGRHAPKDCPTLRDGDTYEKYGKYCENCHWDMYPYSELIEDHKDYDRDTVRAVLNCLQERGLLKEI